MLKTHDFGSSDCIVRKSATWLSFNFSKEIRGFSFVTSWIRSGFLE